MRKWPRNLAGILAVAGATLFAMAQARAETCSLELKRLGAQSSEQLLTGGSNLDQKEKLEKENPLAKLFGIIGGISSSDVVVGPRNTLVSAQAGSDYKAVKVRKGKTVKLPFGPPYKPVVNSSMMQGKKRAVLQLSLVGSAGETCSNLMVKGKRPKSPRFTITTTDGTEVDQGKFEYG